MAGFRTNQPLPAGHGGRLDERVVEYPWVLARLDEADRRPLLDAGATLVFPYLLAQPQLKHRPVFVYSLELEPWMLDQKAAAFIRGDLRQSVLRDECLGAIVCLSTLEHIGMDNTRLYTTEGKYAETRPRDYRLAVREFWRMLAPGGQLFITLPFGVYQDLGWLQQFDQGMVDDVVQTFGGQVIDQAYYCYSAAGWQAATAEAASDAVYFDTHTRQEFEPDFAAAARAVVCLQLARA